MSQSLIQDPSGLLRASRRYITMDGQLRVVEPVTQRRGAAQTTSAPVATLPPWDPAPVSTFALDASDLPTSAYAADSLAPGTLTHPSGNVTQIDSWGAAGERYAYADGYPDVLTARSVASAVDVDVVGWMRAGTLYARLTDAGRCFYLYHFGEGGGRIEIGVAEGVLPGATTPTSTAVLYETNNATADVPGYDAGATAGDLFRLRLRGTGIYAEFSPDGGATWATIWASEYAAWVHMEGGRGAWRGDNSPNYGHRRFGFTTYNEVPVWSTPAESRWDARDFGLKELSATGSMQAGSNVVTGIDTSGFAVGDRIAVEIGGEPGQGARGTLDGVGGYLPGRSVATLADLPAGQPGVQQPSWYVESEAFVYTWQYNNNLGVDEWSVERNYYREVPVPISLLATVTDIGSGTLTLDAPAVNPATGATVHYDNLGSYLFTTMLRGAPGAPATPTIELHEGRFALAGKVDPLAFAGVIVDGAGKWHTEFVGVRGAPSLGLDWSNSPSLGFHNIGFIGRFRAEGGYYTAENTPALYGQSCANASISNIRVVDVPNGIAFQYSSDILVSRCHGRTVGNVEYTQWMYQHPDCERGVWEYLSLESDFLHPGFEPFKTSGSVYRGISGYNAFTSNNGANGSTFYDGHLRIGLGAENPLYVGTANNQVSQFNANAAALVNGGGGTVRKWVVAEDGPPSVDGTTFMTAFGASAPSWENITVEDMVHWIAPEYRDLTLPEQTRFDVRTVAVALEGNPASNHVISAVRSYGMHPQGYHPGGTIALQGDASGTIQNCVANSIGYGTNGVDGGGNLTLAAWQAATDRSALPVADFVIESVKGAGSVDVRTFTINGDGTTTAFAYSPWGKLVRFVFEFLDEDGVTVLETSRVRDATWRFYRPGFVRLTVTDEDLQTATITKAVAGP